MTDSINFCVTENNGKTTYLKIQGLVAAINPYPANVENMVSS